MTVSTTSRVLDGNEAVASVAHRLSEVLSIYPITPASPMGELSDQWTANKKTNIWGAVPSVVEMQSEGGAAGMVHGSLQGGALSSTFTASQGLLLMLPNLYKIAGELTPCCIHVAARTIATHALSIFGDHSDVMACRQAGWAMLCSGSVQEAHDLACIAHSATLETRVPFLHFFDGFRTSHEIQKIQMLSDDDLKALIDEEAVSAHRQRALTPDRPVVRGTAQNPDTFFQAREAANYYYDACPEIVLSAMERFSQRTGRQYRLFDYVGHPKAEHVVVLMGSGVGAAEEAVERLSAAGERVGLVKVRLYRPFSVDHFVACLPPSTKRIAVLDRTKEPGCIEEPLCADIRSALAAARSGDAQPVPEVEMIIGGRYGLSSKEFTPAMVRAIFEELRTERPRREFTVGITDDLTHLSLDSDEESHQESDETLRAVFFGLGSDGTVGANKATVKIVGEETDLSVQGYFVYDSKKAGATTVSHLRFGKQPIRSTYQIRRAQFVACHQATLLEQLDVLSHAEDEAVLLLNAPDDARFWRRLPGHVRAEIRRKRLRVHTIDAHAIAHEVGLGQRINTVMQAAFFCLADVIPRELAVEKIRSFIESTYSRAGPQVVKRNLEAVDLALARLRSMEVPEETSEEGDPRPEPIPDHAPDFVKHITNELLAGRGDLLPVSAFPADGTWPTGTARWEKRALAKSIPIWDPDICIQCNKCALVCPHAAIRPKVFEPSCLEDAPEDFPSLPSKMKEYENLRYTLQVAPDDCTGCRVCVVVCPAKDKGNPRHKAIDMMPVEDHADRERERFEFFSEIPQPEKKPERLDVRGCQILEPLFEFSGACAGCGETPYVKLLTQLFGDRAVIANATGCSSIYGGNLPTTPFTTDCAGRGPAWNNSLFEDNAEFGLGFRVSYDRHREEALSLVRGLASELGEDLVEKLTKETDIDTQRGNVSDLKLELPKIDSLEALRLKELADYLVPKSVWAVGGDGWAYDIGFGGLDHILSMDWNVNILVLDTEVYSNTGGQQSKATPRGATAKFATAGKSLGKKDLGLIAMSYGHVYVAQVAYGAKDSQVVQAFLEAESYPGPSLIIAYSHCIAHGYDMQFGPQQQKLATGAGIWPLYRFDPRRIDEGKAPLDLETPSIKNPPREYLHNEARFRAVERRDPKRFEEFVRQTELDAARRISLYKQLSEITLPAGRSPTVAKES